MINGVNGANLVLLAHDRLDKRGSDSCQCLTLRIEVRDMFLRIGYSFYRQCHLFVCYRNEDQFQDRSLTSDDFVSIQSSESVSSSSAIRLFREVDSLLDGNDDDKRRAFDLLKAEEESVRASASSLSFH